MSQTIEQFLNSARIAIENSLENSELQTHLSEFGYTIERIQVGKALYDATLAAQQRQTSEFGDRIAATATLTQARTTAHKTYMRLVKIARVAFKGNPGLSTKLALGGKRKESLSGWLLQAQQFYANALDNEDIQAGLASYGITAEKLQAGQAEVEAVADAANRQKEEMGDSQAATQARDAAIDALDDWLADFRELAKIALEDDPQLLEMLGIQR